jgi:hypothetical protein
LHGRQRPSATRSTADGLKLHRRVVRCDGRTLTVITLRPGTESRFSTNYFHETWHILSDFHGSRLLGRLLWGLAFQRNPGTVVLIDRPYLDPTPFEAEPASPILLVPEWLTPLRAPTVRALRRMLPLTAPSTGTVRWHTPGLEPAVEAAREAPFAQHRPWVPDRGQHSSIGPMSGMLVWSGGPAALRRYATEVYRLGEHAWDNMDYVDVGRYDGEVQVFGDYRRRVAAARVGRREVTDSLPEPPPPESLNPMIWTRGAQVRRRALRPLPAADSTS